MIISAADGIAEVMIFAHADLYAFQLLYSKHPVQVCEALIRQIHIGTADLDAWLAAEVVVLDQNMQANSACVVDGTYTHSQHHMGFNTTFTCKRSVLSVHTLGKLSHQRISHHPAGPFLLSCTALIFCTDLADPASIGKHSCALLYFLRYHMNAIHWVETLFVCCKR